MSLRIVLPLLALAGAALPAGAYLGFFPEGLVRAATRAQAETSPAAPVPATPAPAVPEPGADPFAVDTLPPQVAATVGQTTILAPRRIVGGTPPFARSLTGGPDATLVALGSIRVAPTKAGTSGPYTLTVVDARGRTASTQMHVVASPALTLSGSAPGVATTGQPYRGRFEAQGGRPPYAWSFSGLSPAGLSFSNGLLAGVPLQAGTSQGMVVTATDVDNRQVYSGEFSVEVADPLSVQALPPAVSVTVGNGLALPAPSVSGGTPPYAPALAGGPGARLGPDGSLHIAPTAPGPSGPYVLTVRDARGRTAATRTTVAAVSPLQVSTYPDAVLALGIEASVPGPFVSGGTPPYAFDLVLDATGEPVPAPPGLALSRPAGVLAGIPARAGGNGPYRIRVSDAAGRKADSLAFAVSVSEAAEAGPATPREVYVDGRLFCSSTRANDCARAGDFESVEVRYAALQRVNELSFGCEFSAVPSGVWEISDGRRWTTVTPAYATPCAAGIPTTAVRSVRYTRADGTFSKLWAPRAAYVR